MPADDLPVFFIRHADTWTGANAVPGLLAENRVGIMYDGGRSWDPADYEKSGKTAFRYLTQWLDDRPCLVVASYSLKGQDNVVTLGVSVPGSKELRGTVKTVQLRDVRRLTISDFSLPFLVPPRGGTLVRWHKGTQGARWVYENTGKRPGLTELWSYSPFHFELLAAEWLRDHGVLRRQSYRVGSSMKTHDVVGEGDGGKPVLAQVKYDTSSKVVEAYLAAGTKGTQRWFFREHIDSLDAAPSHEREVLLSKVIEYFAEREPGYLNRLRSESWT